MADYPLAYSAPLPSTHIIDEFENIDNNKRLIQKPNGDCDKEFHGDLKYEKIQERNQRCIETKIQMASTMINK